jgi:hypothetical protein
MPGFSCPFSPINGLNPVPFGAVPNGTAANVSQQIWRLERKKALAGVPETLRLFLDETDA